MAIKKPKVVVEDIGIELQKQMSNHHKDYEFHCTELLNYTANTLFDALKEFKSEHRIDKIQLLQEMVQTFLGQLLVEKHILNMEVLAKEMELDDTLAPKLEAIFGKKLVKGSSPKGDGLDDQKNIRFNKG